ncbi:helix-hairpin-helix domain-containing protein [Paenibacillus oenotherae]|uniref:Helix-hairpin-helix domain-containing protein n=1 Tax=Paenibacillus oenotherae TaxID=1435645 RepID=A0ABS7D1L7_9BACL|nr:ComEA family DNA-binding protein [Paenibacillus oenotherae]MBW7473758.1 helix-hairpin-helix domain-containing protein [Paenibacillus oenotherae]
MKPISMRVMRREKAAAAALLLLGLILLAAALWQPKEIEPEGWIEISKQVEQTIVPLEQERAKKELEQAQKQESGQAQKQESGQAKGQEQRQAQGSEQEGAGNSGLIDINRASAEELDALPGIGAAKAAAIVKEREKNGRFRTVEDLLRVKGIGPKMLEKIKSSIVVKP